MIVTLQACVLDFGENWETYIPLIEFAYNKSFQPSIRKAPFEALYERRCRSPVEWFEMEKAKTLGPNLVQEAMDKVKIIQE